MRDIVLVEVTLERERKDNSHATVINDEDARIIHTIKQSNLNAELWLYVDPLDATPTATYDEIKSLLKKRLLWPATGGLILHDQNYSADVNITNALNLDDYRIILSKVESVFFEGII